MLLFTAITTFPPHEWFEGLVRAACVEWGGGKG